jgi:hypothetical protein
VTSALTSASNRRAAATEETRLNGFGRPDPGSAGRPTPSHSGWQELLRIMMARRATVTGGPSHESGPSDQPAADHSLPALDPHWAVAARWPLSDIEPQRQRTVRRRGGPGLPGRAAGPGPGPSMRRLG